MAREFASNRSCEWMVRFRRGRRASVSVMFAAGAVPMIGLVGLAVDFGIWNQTNATLSVAANVAAMTAVRVAANAEIANDVDPPGQGKTAGQQWFASEVGLGSKIGTEGVALTGTFGAKVAVVAPPNGTVTATVAYQGTVPSVFGFALFGVGPYNIEGQAVAEITTAPFLNVDILLDNSGSMEIGATDNDILALQAYTPCSYGATVPKGKTQPPAPGAVYPGAQTNAAQQNYDAYQTSGYDGGINPPVAVAEPGLGYTTFTATTKDPGPSCKGVLPADQQGAYPTAGAPCAFACHFDHSSPAGTGNDYYAIARRFAGLSNAITLRFDTVKAATNEVITAMQTDNISSINNLNVGIFTFDVGLVRVYPESPCNSGPACEAGNDWATAIGDVGAPPNTPYGPDTGIQPSTAGNGNGNSDFHDTMVALSNTLSPSSNGTDAQHPRKVLFLISDGLVDYTSGTRTLGAVNPSDCALFKAMQYTVYVVYTPYNPVMNTYYINNVKPITEPPNTGQLATALQACASSAADYIAANNAQELNTALQTFLKQALNSPARFTM